MLQLFDWLSDLTGIRAIRSNVPMASRWDEVTLDVPAYRQVNTFSCGASAGYSVVATFNPKVKYDEFYDMLDPIPGEGVHTNRLVKILRQFGVGCRVKEYMSFKEIQTSIDDGYPIIVGRLTEHGQDHWAVIYGYGADPKRVFLIGRSGNPLLSACMDWDAFRSGFRAVRGPAIQCWGK